ncbi:MAG: hypothetical protein ACOYK6_04895 [Chthoniobacterales bacterium]
MRKFIIIVCYAWCSIAIGHAANYYVSVSGNDSNPGTIQLPWRSVDKVNATSLYPGDSVYFHGGETFLGSLLLTQSGSDQQPIVIGSYGGAQAILESHDQNTIYGYNTGGFQIENLILINSGTQGSGVMFFTDDAPGKNILE